MCGGLLGAAGRRLLVGLGLMLGVGAFAAGGDLPDPEKPGPYPVGVTTILCVDNSRTDAVTGGPRSLMTEILSSS